MHSSLIKKLRLIIYKTQRLVRSDTISGLIARTPLKLHLGCGGQHWEGWLNIDVNENSAADLIMDFREIKNIFKVNTVDEIAMMHSISYLRLWEAKDLFHEMYSLLKKGGKCILEFPDILKCATHILKHEKEIIEYLEGIRAIYAFDMQQIKRKEQFGTYAFGWSAWHIKHELHNVGFSDVRIMNPETHNKLAWRDTRIEATK